MNIPPAAIEAAKEAMREVTPPPGVTKADWLAEHGDFALIAGAIAAAAPHLKAEARAAEWRRIPLGPCRNCPKLTTSDREVCQRCEKGAAAWTREAYTVMTEPNIGWTIPVHQSFVRRYLDEGWVIVEHADTLKGDDA